MNADTWEVTGSEAINNLLTFCWNGRYKVRGITGLVSASNSSPDVVSQESLSHKTRGELELQGRMYRAGSYDVDDESYRETQNFNENEKESDVSVMPTSSWSIRSVDRV